MQAQEQTSSSFDFQKEIARAKWYKEDLEKGGWKEAVKGPGSVCWTKSYPEEEVPVKVLFTFDMEMPVEYVLKMLDPSTQDTRPKWDKAFTDLEVLESNDHGEYVTYSRTAASGPITSRSFVLLVSPIKELDWYGKKCFIMFQKNVTHPSKPVGQDSFIRAQNGGNFYMAIPDDEEPTTKSKFFGLSNNNYNGWLPNWEWLHARIVHKGTGKITGNMVEGYNMLYKGKE
ncbi:uncharacterized protein [Montipora capricornis]|uniref:uncharacterized protein n=1 Tax=Montipora capricornis TaxID=246305 RepID=UPI0035F11CF4